MIPAFSFQDPSLCRYLPEGVFSIGVDEPRADMIAAAVDGVQVKASYLMNLCPRHELFLPAVCIARRLVSAEEFALFIRETGFTTEAEREGWGWTWERGMWVKKEGLCWNAPLGGELDGRYREMTGLLPAIQVSWNDAAAFCRWASRRTGLALSLPGEAQWERWAELEGIACIGEASCAEADGAEMSLEAFLDEMIRQSGEPSEGHRPGMVWEWCADWFDAYPGGAWNREFGTTYKVLRGGSAMSAPVQKSLEYRFRRCPTARSPFYGFRVMISSPEKHFM